MTKKYKKLTSGTLAAALALASIGMQSRPARAEELEEKQYVIVAETDAAYERAVEAALEGAEPQDEGLSDHNVAVARLSEEEAARLQRLSEVTVEEDFTLSASAAADGDVAATSKEEKIRWKRERLEQAQKALEEAAESAEPEWNLLAVGAEGADAPDGTPKERVKVAVLDSGVDFVSGINLEGYVNLVEEERHLSDVFQDMTGHGTGVAAIISGNGEGGVRGVNPNAEVYSVRVLDGENRAPLSRVVRGIYWCVENGMDVINMSFGTTTRSAALEKAVEDACAAGVLMVAASGNGGGAVEYPAAYEGTLAVASTDARAEISEFSGMGEEVGVAAPGERIRTAGFFNGTVVTHGTSVAAPHVTGAASLLWERDLTKPAEFIRQLIERSAKRLEDEEGCGLLDVGYAMEQYDAFAEQYEEGAPNEEALPENTEEPERFDYIEEDEGYVEGRWIGKVHESLVVNNVGAAFSEDDIKMLKEGAVLPDSEWHDGSGDNPWHGRWAYRPNAGYNKGNKKINYAAVVEMVTTIALKGGDVSSFTGCGEFLGLSQELFDYFKFDISTWYTVNQRFKTERERKHILYGCGIHVLTDIFAHSTTNEKGDRIDHPDADDITKFSRRHKTASQAVAEALDSLRTGRSTDGLDIIYALKKTYLSDTKYHLINVKQYVAENGYGGMNEALLNRVNINFAIN